LTFTKTISNIELTTHTGITSKFITSGLFRTIAITGVVKNLKIDGLTLNVSYSITDTSSANYTYTIGIVSGENARYIENVSVTNSKILGSGIKNVNKNTFNIGGLVGSNSRAIINSYILDSTIDFSITHDKTDILKVGGLVGYGSNNSTILNSYSVGSMKIITNVTNSTIYLGGIVGELSTNSAYIINSYTFFSLTAINESESYKSLHHFGPVVGLNSNFSDPNKVFNKTFYDMNFQDFYSSGITSFNLNWDGDYTEGKNFKGDFTFTTWDTNSYNSINNTNPWSDDIWTFSTNDSHYPIHH